MMMSKDKTLWFDLETTGLFPYKHGILQIACIYEEAGVEVERRDFQMAPCPQDEVDPRALAVNGVVLETLQSRTPATEAFAEFTAWLDTLVNKFEKEDKLWLAGFNSQSFDEPFLRAWWKKLAPPKCYFGSYFNNPTKDVYVLAAFKLASKRDSLENFKLKTLCTACGIELENAHEGMADVAATRDLGKFLLTL